MLSTRSQIFIPLMTMILLTFVAGGTAFRQTRELSITLDHAFTQVSQLLMMNNVRWTLRDIDQYQKQSPEQAQQIWQEAQQEVREFSNSAPYAMLPGSLQQMITHDTPRPELLDSLKNDTLRINLSHIEDQLKTFQQHAEFVNGMTSFLMICLGLFLTAITGYDLERLVKALSRSRDLNVTLQEEERRRIAQELHDGVVQDLVDLKRQYSPEKVDTLINNLRRVCHNLKPQVLDDLGLAAALEFLADDLRQFGVPKVKFNIEPDELSKLPKSYELPLFRVIQELCSNIKNHAQANQVTLALAYNPDEDRVLRGYIRDNGKGFDPQKAFGKGLGLTGVQERIQQLGGKVTIESKPGAGSNFQFVIPVKENEPNNT